MKKNKGVLTLEAALVVPLFVFFIMFIGQFMKVVSVYDSVQTNIYNTAKFVNGYTYLAEATKLNNFVDSASPINTKELLNSVQGIFSKETTADAEIDKLVNSLLSEGAKALSSEVMIGICNNNLKGEFNENKMKRYGIDNFNFNGTKLTLGKGGEIRVAVEYNIKVGVPFFNLNKAINLKNQVVLKSFTGA